MSQKQKASFKEGNVPPGGTCLSSFVMLTTGPDLLIGKMRSPEVWVERFFVGADRAPSIHKSEKYLVPASHLAWYESPLEAAERVVKEQIMLPLAKEDLRLVEVQSHVSGDVASLTEPPHWDICFIYEVRVPKRIAKKLRQPEWFGELGFIPKSRLKPEDFTRGHGEVLETAGVIGKTKKKKQKH